MAGGTDKARFYLEKSISDTHELEAKKILSKREISSVIKKRSDFEHLLCSRDCQVTDFERYVRFETNLDTLQRKRAKRLAVKSTAYHGQRRVFLIFERATQKFPGDLGMWIAYAGFARKTQAHIKVSEILTRMLRLHPARPELWIYAASYALEEVGDMMEARSYLQRGLRFIEKDPKLWLEYARLELIFIAKLAGRQKILGLDKPLKDEKDSAKKIASASDDIIALSPRASSPIHGTMTIAEPDSVHAKAIDDNLILSGAIPIAILKAATSRLGEGYEDFGLEFFDMVTEFDQLPCKHAILGQILSILRSKGAKKVPTLIRYVQYPLFGIQAGDTDFSGALGLALSRISKALSEADNLEDKVSIKLGLLEWMMSMLNMSGLDDHVSEVLKITTRKLWNDYQVEVGPIPSPERDQSAALHEAMEERGLSTSIGKTSVELAH